MPKKAWKDSTQARLMPSDAAIRVEELIEKMTLEGVFEYMNAMERSRTPGRGTGKGRRVSIRRHTS